MSRALLAVRYGLAISRSSAWLREVLLRSSSTNPVRLPHSTARALAAATLELTLDIGSHNGATFPCRLGSSSLRRERRTSPLVASDRPNPVMLSRARQFGTPHDESFV